MFLTGSRVKVLYSSLRGNMGPRKGSEGFIANTLIKPYFDSLPDKMAMSMPNFNFISYTYNIFFYKYGNEQRERCERRWFTTLVPMSTHLHPDEQMEQFAEMFLTFCKDGDLFKQGEPSKGIIKRLGKHSHFGVLKPINCDDASLMTPAQTRCFVNSVREQRFLQSTFIAQKKLVNRSGICDESVLVHLLANSKRNWQKIIEHPNIQYGDKKTTIVDLYRGLLTIFNNQNMRKVCSSKDSLERNVEWAVNGLFSYPTYAKERRRQIEQEDILLDGITRRVSLSTISMVENLTTKFNQL